MFEKFIAPLRIGHVLKNVETWKKLQNLISAISGAIPLIALFVPQAQVLLDSGFLLKLYAALGAIQVYLTTATTDKIGLK